MRASSLLDLHRLKPHHRFLFTLGLALVVAAVTVTAIPNAGLARPAPTPEILKTCSSQAASAFPSRLSQTGSDIRFAPTAPGDTTYFGGTAWNADSLRWEAIPGGTWTFDSGVGSNFDHSHPDVDPFKDPSRHAFMEGWVGRDFTAPEPSTYSFFRRMTYFDTEFWSECGLDGGGSMWAGVTESEGDSLCYQDGQGYGDSWDTTLEQEFTYNGSGNIFIDFDYLHHVESGFDYVYLWAEYPGQPTENLAEFTGLGSGTHNVVFTPPQTGPFTLVFQVVSDGGFSDEDGGYITSCGAFTFDNLSITGGGISYFSGFESDAGGWTLGAPPLPGPGGDYTDIVAVADIDTVGAACTVLQDSVLVFFDDTGTPSSDQYNFALSPWIDLKSAGVEFDPFRFVEMDVFNNSPTSYLLGFVVRVQYSPYVCPSTGATLELSPWFGSSAHLFDDPFCDNWSIDLTDLSPPGIDRIRIAVGIDNRYCNYFPCSGDPNTSPWVDNIRFGTIKSLLTGVVGSQPRDAFPTDGTSGISSPARVDQVFGGDTLMVSNLVTDVPGQETEVVFAVDPGPGIDGAALTAWLTSHGFVENSRGKSWYSARMDTLETAGNPIVQTGYWMTSYHEDDPNFTGTDTDLDPNDPGGLLNDIFPDDLFTPGTRLNLYYRARASSMWGEWSTWPDTTGGYFLEMDVLPSSLTGGGTNNSVLYVNADTYYTNDHAYDDPRPVVEEALGALLPGGSANVENTAWDRCDHWVSSLTADWAFAIPAQLDAYETIIWNCGEDRGLTHQDAALLRSWLESPGGTRNLYLSGTTYLVWDMGTQGGELDSLLTGPLGSQYLCRDITDAECPPGAPADIAACFVLAPEDTALVADSPYRMETMRVFPTIDTIDYPLPAFAPHDSNNTGWADERYVGDETKHFASVANHAAGPFSYRTVLDGNSVHLRFQGPDCALTGQVDAATQRLREVFTFFGQSVIGVPGDTPTALSYRLGAPRPNPLTLSTEIRFELPRTEAVSLTVFDIQGRVVRTLVDESLEAGDHTITWNGRNNAGSEVPAGVYFYRLSAGTFRGARKIVVVR